MMMQDNENNTIILGKISWWELLWIEKCVEKQEEEVPFLSHAPEGETVEWSHSASLWLILVYNCPLNLYESLHNLNTRRYSEYFSFLGMHKKYS